MIYDWYKIINLATFDGLNIPSRELTLELEGIGEKTIRVTKGNLISILYEGIFLSAHLNEKNPFEFEDHAIYVDGDDDIWLGIKAEDQTP